MQFFERYQTTITVVLKAAFVLTIAALILVLFILFSTIWKGEEGGRPIAHHLYKLVIMMSSAAATYLALGLLANLFLQQKLWQLRFVFQVVLSGTYVAVFFCPLLYYLCRYIANEL